MKRILQLGKFYPPEWGGVEAVTASLAEGFAARGIDSRAIVFTRNLPGHTRINGVELTRCHAAWIYKSQPVSWRWLVEGVRQSRVATTVIVHWPNIFGAVVVPFIRRPRIVTFWHAGVINKGWLGFLTRPLTKYLLARSATILVTSDPVAQTRDFDGVRAKVRVLPLGIEDPAKLPAEPMREDIVKFLDDRAYAFAVGRLVPYKGFDQLILAARSLPPHIATVIAGGGPQQRDLEDLVARYGLQDRVLVTGRLDERDLNALFASATVFVLPSVDKAEAFGVVQLEAMAHGLPIIATDIPESGAGWVSGRGSIGALVPVAEPEIMAEAIRRIADSPNRGTLRELSRHRFEQLFTADRMVATALTLLDAEVGETQHGPCASGARPQDT